MVAIETHLHLGVSGHQGVNWLKDLEIQMSNPVILNHLSFFFFLIVGSWLQLNNRAKPDHAVPASSG